MRLRWWKLLSIVLVFYSLYFGLMGEVPSKDILNETIRNLYYHVPMWFCMILLFSYAFVYAIRYLSSNNIQYDLKSAAFNKVGIVFSVLGMITGMEWATYTWGEPWSNDPKQLGTALCMLIYFAYLVYVMV